MSISNEPAGHDPADVTRCNALSEEIWKRPELRFREYFAAESISAILRDAGFSLTRNLAGMPTAFVAEYGAAGPVIALLGEYDALDSMNQEAGAAVKSSLDPRAAGHGCGHHLLGAGALLAALSLRRFLERTGTAGRIRYYGCPAEEGGSGKVFLVRDGLFDDVDIALTWHPGPVAGLKSYRGRAIIQKRYRFEGKASHASWTPQLGRSALDAMTLTNVGVQFLREHVPPHVTMQYAMLDAGDIAPNVVQAASELDFVVRAADIRDAASVSERVRQVAEGAALMSGVKVTEHFVRATSEIRVVEALEAVMMDSMMSVGPVPFDSESQKQAQRYSNSFTASDRSFFESNFGALTATPLRSEIFPRTPMDPAGTTDVGDVSQVVPTGQFWGACFAQGTPFHSWQMVAQGMLPAAKTGMVHAASAMAETARRLFDDPALIDTIAAEFRAGAQDPYVCPIPAHVAPPKFAELPAHD